ncbi:MAG: gliding motility-associated C-terminal domain-containing protein [Bacteroidota bacterium]
MKLWSPLFLMIGTAVFGQNALHNFGRVQIHDNTSIGLHLDFINDGLFSQNTGLVGFYSQNTSLSISGTREPILFDTEIAVEEELFLDIPVQVANNLNFISGNIITPKNRSDIVLNFLEDAFYVGESDNSKVNGNIRVINTENFVFPVGVNQRLRPLQLESEGVNTFVQCAYFFENPDNPSSLNKDFRISQKADISFSISQMEFWRLEGDMPAKVTLTWDAVSDVGVLGEVVSDLKVVGWSKAENQWSDLGRSAVEGDISGGSLTSQEFIPNEYEIITIGGNTDATDNFKTLKLENYYLSANGDGKNDFLVFEGIENYPENTLQIFDRNGIMVYSKSNYDNTFDGLANQGALINKYAGLPSGVYFYIVTLFDVRQRHQGYLYLTSGR